MNDVAEASGDLLRAEELARAAPDPDLRTRLEADIRTAQGELPGRAEPQQALAAFDSAIELYAKRHLVLELGRAYQQRARARRASGDSDAAESDLWKAVTLFESERATLRGEDERRTFADASQELFDALLALSTESAQPPIVSLAIAERARLTGPAVAPRQSAGAIRGISRDDAMVREDFMIATLRRRFSELPRDCALIEYAWLDDRLLIWTVREGQLTLTVRTVPRQQLRDAIRERVNQLRSAARPATIAAKDELSALLASSAVRNLRPQERLLIVPDKSLAGLPFAALRDPATGEYLVEHHAISILPSAMQLFALLDRQRREVADPRAGASVVAASAFDRSKDPDLPPLPGAEDEVRQVAHLYPRVTILSDTDATRWGMLSMIDRNPVLHFSGHAMPTSSGRAIRTSSSQAIPATPEATSSSRETSRD